jgi:lysozyme family protein
MNLVEYALEHILLVEGEFQNDYNDNGNWTSGIVGRGQLKGTKFGISAAAYPTLDIENLTWEVAEKLYRRDYWTPLDLDELEPGLALAAFDWAVHSGVDTVRWYMNAVLSQQGGLPDLMDYRYEFIVTLDDSDLYYKGWVRRLRKLERAIRNYAEPVELIRIHRGNQIIDYLPQATTEGRTIHGGRKIMARVRSTTWWQRLFGVR